MKEHALLFAIAGKKVTNYCTKCGKHFKSKIPRKLCTGCNYKEKNNER
jgi:Zn finger protein HypA/HybF involved in hydrogenase expression